jgi:zinc/manganese transport system ATP-binding protein
MEEPMLSPAPGIRFHNVTLGYDGVPAIDRLTGEVASGSLTAIVGHNGAGKSTLLKGITGQLRPLKGHIEIADGLRRSMAYLPQHAAIDRTFPITVFELAALGLWPRLGAFRDVGRAEREHVAQAISAVGLEGLERRTLDQLSGGQLQRVLFARVLVQDSPLVLLDEPFASIDARTTTDLVKLVARWHDEQRTVLAVLHDLDLVRERFPNALVLAREVVAWGETEAVLTPATLRKARAVAARWEEDAPLRSRRVPA